MSTNTPPDSLLRFQSSPQNGFTKEPIKLTSGSTPPQPRIPSSNYLNMSLILGSSSFLAYPNKTSKSAFQKTPPKFRATPNRRNSTPGFTNTSSIGKYRRGSLSSWTNNKDQVPLSSFQLGEKSTSLTSCAHLLENDCVSSSRICGAPKSSTKPNNSHYSSGNSINQVSDRVVILQLSNRNGKIVRRGSLSSRTSDLLHKSVKRPLIANVDPQFSTFEFNSSPKSMITEPDSVNKTKPYHPIMLNDPDSPTLLQNLGFISHPTNPPPQTISDQENKTDLEMSSPELIGNPAWDISNDSQSHLNYSSTSVLFEEEEENEEMSKDSSSLHSSKFLDSTNEDFEDLGPKRAEILEIPTNKSLIRSRSVKQIVETRISEKPNNPESPNLNKDSSSFSSPSFNHLRNLNSAENLNDSPDYQRNNFQEPSFQWWK